MCTRQAVQLVPSLLILLALHGVRAGVLFSDAFSYPDGPLVTVANGRWKTHSGTTGQVEVTGGVIKLSQKLSEDVSAAFPGGAVGPTQADAVYARFTVRFSALPTGNGGYFAHLKDTTATTGMRCRIFATTNDAAPGMFRLGIAAATNTPSAMLPRDLALHTPYRVACRMLLSDNTATLWLTPKSENDPGVTSTDTAAPKIAAAFAFRQSLSGRAGMGELTVDDLVVATAFAELFAASPPMILTEPQDQTVAAGSEVVFTVEASGTEPLSYQWYFDSMACPEATNAVFRLPRVSLEHAGTYEVVVSNETGSASAQAILTVGPPTPALMIFHQPPTSVQLRWTATPWQLYSLWAADDPTRDYAVLVTDLVFGDEYGRYEDSAAERPSRFYRLSCP